MALGELERASARRRREQAEQLVALVAALRAVGAEPGQPSPELEARLARECRRREIDPEPDALAYLASLVSSMVPARGRPGGPGRRSWLRGSRGLRRRIS